MIDYEAFCRGYESGYDYLPDFRCPKQEYERRYWRDSSVNGWSNNAGYWLGRIHRMEELNNEPKSDPVCPYV